AKQRLKQQSNTQEYKKLYPKEWKELKIFVEGKDYSKEIEKIKKIKMTEAQATRDINGDILTQVAEILPNMFGGSADVAVSTMAFDKNAKDFSANDYAGKLIRFGVREHAMASISNGIALFGFNLPYQSCFMSFFDYLKPAFRMSALMNICTLLTLSHDSILSGEDGPTHQPIEQLPSIRMIPNTIVSRPYNFTEIIASYVWLLQYKKPTVICVSKDKPTLKQTELEKALCGGYILHNDRRAQLTIVTTGADVTLALNILDRLKENKIYARLVSMPCVDIFEKQKPVYKKSVLKDLPIVFLESSAENCWYKMAKPNDLVLSLNSFGTSAHPLDVQKYMKFDPESLSKRIETWLKKFQNQVEK
ncbi:MAG: transketolase-like TK C-terminal-containing protein, partial [Christensenellales bacterium]